MIMSMYKICITNRHLVTGDFYSQIEKVLKAKPYALILREKDLDEVEYRIMAQKVMEMCKASDTKCILHYFTDVAIDLKAEAIHLPLWKLKEEQEKIAGHFRIIGASVHSVEDALEAQEYGASYVTAGHIFETDCKKGLPGRGLTFLNEVSHAVHLPVYAIGGIHEDNQQICVDNGASGICMMSEYMKM